MSSSENNFSNNIFENLNNSPINELYFIIERIIKKNNRNIVKKYYLTIIKEKSFFILNVGKGNDICVSIDIPNKDQKNIPSNEANIAKIEYKKKCAINSIMEKNGELADLLKSVFDFIQINFDYINTFSFVDESIIYCENRQSISLCDLSYIKYNKTWYQNILVHYQPIK